MRFEGDWTPQSSAENMSGFLAGGGGGKDHPKSYRDMSARLPSRDDGADTAVAFVGTRHGRDEPRWNHGWEEPKQDSRRGHYPLVN